MAKKNKEPEPAGSEAEFANDKKIAAEAAIKACKIIPSGEDMQFQAMSYAPSQIEELSRFIAESDELTVKIKTKEPNLRIPAIMCNSVRLSQCTLKDKGVTIKLENLRIPPNRLDDICKFIKDEIPVIVTLSLYQQRLPVARED